MKARAPGSQPQQTSVKEHQIFKSEPEVRGEYFSGTMSRGEQGLGEFQMLVNCSSILAFKIEVLPPRMLGEGNM